MKKIFAFAALVGLMATSVYAGVNPGTGVVGSKHDINLTAGLVPDSQGRVCAFCHTPHHALTDPAATYAPLWSHNFTAMVNPIPYASATFVAGAVGVVDPLYGPSRLCMSCHDGVVAPDQHYGTMFPGTAPTGRFANDNFGDIAVGKNADFSNDHPIGFKIADAIPTDTGIFATIGTTRTWTLAGVANPPAGKLISKGFYSPAGSTDQYMTCATCHDVHNKDNVANTLANGLDAQHTDTVQGNYFVFAPQSGSQLCTSCHDK